MHRKNTNVVSLVKIVHPDHFNASLEKQMSSINLKRSHHQSVLGHNQNCLAF